VKVFIFNPNPIFDHTSQIETLQPGSVIRTSNTNLTAGGKGINVARVLREFDCEHELLILVGETDKSSYEELLKVEEATYRLFSHPGRVRHANILIESAIKRITVINEQGQHESETAWLEVNEYLSSNMSQGDVLVVMGSLPANTAPDQLVPFIKTAHQAGGCFFVDTTPTWMRGCLSARPDLVKPNIHEALAIASSGSATLMSDEPTSPRKRATEAAEDLCQSGAQVSIVTAGAGGAAMATKGFTDWFNAPSVELVSSIGAGDAFMGGLIVGFAASREESFARRIQRSIPLAMATAASSCEAELAGGATKHRAHQLLTQMNSQQGTQGP
jgi:1-phosphofructokinase family hexose kinase